MNGMSFNELRPIAPIRKHTLKCYTFDGTEAKISFFLGLCWTYIVQLSFLSFIHM